MAFLAPAVPYIIGAVAAAGATYAVGELTKPAGSPDMPPIDKAVDRSGEENDAMDAGRRDFFNKQSLLAGKNNTINTSPMGISSSPLQVARKSLLGG